MGSCLSWPNKGIKKTIDRSQPVCIVGFDLLRCPEGVQEDWPALIATMRAAANKLRTRSCALQGRALLVNSKVLSKLWYKGRFSSPSGTQIKVIRSLAWEAVWAGRTTLKPSIDVGRRPANLGGVGFLDPEVQLYALQAMWMARFLTTRPHPSWWTALNWVLSAYNGDRSFLGSHTSGAARFPECWQPYLVAWQKLHPHWSTDLLEWTPQKALCLPVPQTTSHRARSGLRLIDLVTWNASTSAVTLRSPDSLAGFGAPKRVGKALTALQDGSSTLPASLVHLALSSSSLPPSRSSCSALHAHIQVAGVMLFSLTTALARRYINQSKGFLGPYDWRDRSITKQIGRPPPDIWSRLHHRARSPRHKETFYKFLFNALPLGDRVHHFVLEKAFCHYCPSQVQTMRHFLFSCPLAQCLWRDFRDLYSLPQAVTVQQAAFSWSPQTRVLGRLSS